MSVSPNSPRCRLLVEGYLDVKTPPDSPERILYKAWRRQWVSATAYIPAGRGEPHLIVLVSRAPEDQPSVKKQVKASRDGLRLFRCRSGSRPLQTWALASGSTLLLYLAGKTEEETQRWMATIRDGLWPPILVVPSQTGTSHEVSLIDDEKSFNSGLLGVYGRLVHTSEDVISVIHPHWQGTQMRWRLDDILDVRLIRTVGKDNVAGVFHIALRRTGGDTRTLLFYSNTAKTTIEWIRCLLQTMKSDQRPTNKVNSSPSPIQTYKRNSISGTSSEYAVVQKSEAADKLNAPLQTGNDTPGDLEIGAKSYKTTAMNMPDAFLNASMSSSMFRQANMDKSPNSTGEHEKVNGQKSGEDSDDSSEEIYEHLYEDLDISKETRSYTVYEEVDDGADEYVPPMPPSLPKRQPAAQHQKPDVKSLEPAALRLQKLCESVTEALKRAEEAPALASGNSDLLQKQKSQKRKKKDGKALVKHESLRREAKLEAKLSAVAQSESAGYLKRAVSDSEIKKTSTNGCDLPLMPFNHRTESDSSHKKEPRPEKPNHLPLKDILKNLKVGSNGENLIGNRNSEKHKISQSVGSDVKKSSISCSEETEAQYLDMS